MRCLVYLRRAAETGFSLTETMIGVLVLAIGLLAMNRMQMTAIRDNSVSQRRMTALALAEHKLEELKNTPYDDIHSEASTPVGPDEADFTREVTVTTDSPVADAKTVSVTVRWHSGTRSYVVPLATVISQ